MFLLASAAAGRVEVEATSAQMHLSLVRLFNAICISYLYLIAGGNSKAEPEAPGRDDAVTAAGAAASRGGVAAAGRRVGPSAGQAAGGRLLEEKHLPLGQGNGGVGYSSDEVSRDRGCGRKVSLQERLLGLSWQRCLAVQHCQ